MPTVTLYANASAAIKTEYPDYNFSANATETIADAFVLGNTYLLTSFAPIADSLKYKKLSSAQMYAYLTPGNNYLCYTRTRPLLSAFNQSTVTYNTSPWRSDVAYTSETMLSGGYARTLFDSTLLGEVLRNGVWIAGEGAGTIATSRSANRPYIVVTYEDEAVTPNFVGLSPIGGYKPPGQATTFRWGFGKSAPSYGEFTQASGIFRWRRNASSTATSVNVGTATSYTVAANTFTGDSFQWQIQATMNTGAVITSSWYTVSIIEPASTATAQSPVSTIIDGTSDAAFSWRHIISTGTAPTGYDLQYSTDGSAFSALQSGSGGGMSAVVPANTLPSGEVWWRVRTYNTDRVAGEWSEAVKIIIVAAPGRPVVTVGVASPRPVIQWQSGEQQAYEAVIGGWESGHRFGTAKSIRSGVYLADGTHTAGVRVQNRYGLWSEYGTVSFTVSNVPGAAITLSVSPSHIARLSWSTAGAYDFFYVYRGGELIARTAGNGYVDNTSYGTVSYQVRGAYSGSDHYTLSNTVTVAVAADTVMIASLATGRWMTLANAEVSMRESSVTLTRQTAYMNFAGQAYPSVEISEFSDRYLTFTATIRNEAEMDRFEALLGETVCVKNKYRDMVIGVLDGIDKTSKPFFATYNCSVRRIQYDEVIGHD